MALTTGINAIDSLVHSSWNSNAHTPARLTYSFLASVPSDASADDRAGFKPMTLPQQQAVREAFAKWAAVANITFTEVGSGAQIQLGTNTQSNSAAYAYLPDKGISHVYLYTSTTEAYNFNFTSGTYGPSVLLHEIGHTLGLKHPGNYDSSGGGSDGPFLPSSTDNGDYTQMSYNNPASTRIDGKYASTPMLYDIQAIQYLYGANMSYHAGDDTYSFTSTIAASCIWDAGGNNTFDFSACSSKVQINLAAGSFSETSPGLNNVSIAYGVTIQKAIAGSGGSLIRANDAGNTIVGGNGADEVYEGAGNDVISGGAGNDTVVFGRSFASYQVVRSADSVTVTGDGADLLSGIELLRFSDQTIRVSDLAISTPIVLGTSANDVLTAHAGNESFDGGLGLDTLLTGAARAGFSITANGAGFTLNDLAGAGGQDQLANIERISFTDRSVALDVNGDGGMAYRLYQAAFDRAPDLGGLGYWMLQLDRGTSMIAVAQSFMDSAEFSQLYGTNLSDRQFLTQVYDNVLHRLPDSGGIDWYAQRLAEGASRAAVLVSFSESVENKAQLIGQIQNGMDYIPYTG